MMRQGLWRNVLRFLVKVSHIDINEELLRENEYLKAEIDVYRKQLERLGKRPRFTDGMRRRQAGQASAAFPEPQRLRGALRPHPQDRMPGAACPRRGEVPPQGSARVRGALSDGATAPGHRQLPGRAGWKNHGCAP